MSSDNLISAERVAEMLGLSVKTIFSMVWQRRLKCFKLSARALRFKESDIREFIASKSVEANPIPRPAIKRPGSGKRGRPRKSSAGLSYVSKLVEQTIEEVQG